MRRVAEIILDVAIVGWIAFVVVAIVTILQT